MSIIALQRKIRLNEMEIYKRKTNHILHLILSLLGGLWLPVWVVVTISNAIERGKAKQRIAALDRAILIEVTLIDPDQSDEEES